MATRLQEQQNLLLAYKDRMQSAYIKTSTVRLHSSLESVQTTQITNNLKVLPK